MDTENKPLETNDINANSDEIRSVITEAINKPKKRGRPKKDANKSDNPDSGHSRVAASSKSKSEVEPLGAEDVALIGGLVGTVCGLVDGIVGKRVEGIALAISGDEKYARKVCAETSMTDYERKQTIDYSVLIAQKYGLSAKYCPEVGLLIVVGGYGARVTMTLKELKNLAIKLKRIDAIKPSSEQNANNGQ